MHLLFVVFHDPFQAKWVIPALAPANLSYHAEHTAYCFLLEERSFGSAAVTTCLHRFQTL